MEKDKLLTFDEMKEKAKKFYKALGVDVPDDKINRAVYSLTMPQYAKVYNDKNDQKIFDHSALATVGDAVCAAYLMLKEYSDGLSKQELTNKKGALENEELNKIGEKMCGGKLFASNNDLESNNENGNKKAYATAFEAVIGFIALLEKQKSLNSKSRLWKILDEYLYGNVDNN